VGIHSIEFLRTKNVRRYVRRQRGPTAVTTAIGTALQPHCTMWRGSVPSDGRRELGVDEFGPGEYDDGGEVNPFAAGWLRNAEQLLSDDAGEVNPFAPPGWHGNVDRSPSNDDAGEVNPFAAGWHGDANRSPSDDDDGEVNPFAAGWHGDANQLLSDDDASEVNPCAPPDWYGDADQRRSAVLRGDERCGLDVEKLDVDECDNGSATSSGAARRHRATDKWHSEVGAPPGYVDFGRPIGHKGRIGALRHPFGDDDIITRRYTVTWGFFGLLVIFLILLSPLSPLFFEAVRSMAVPWLQGIAFLLVTLLFGFVLVMIQKLNRPTRVRWAFTKSCLPVFMLTALAVTTTRQFVQQLYFADCEAPYFGPSGGGARTSYNCPGYGTRCDRCHGHGTPYFNASATDWALVSCACDESWGPSHYEHAVEPCSVREDGEEPTDQCTDCVWCQGYGIATVTAAGGCECDCSAGYERKVADGKCTPQSATSYSDDAITRIDDAVEQQFKAMMAVSAILAGVALVGILLYGRLILFHSGYITTPTFSDRHRDKMRMAAASAIGFQGSSLPPPMPTPPLLPGTAGAVPRMLRWLSRAYARVSVHDAVGESGAFVYPTTVLLAGVITPFALAYGCVYIYFLFEIHVIAELERLDDTLNYYRAKNTEYLQSLRSLDSTYCGTPATISGCTAIEGAIGYLTELDHYLATSDEWIGNLATAALYALIAAEAVAAVYAMGMVWKNIAGFKRWTLTSFAGGTVPGFNVTTNRKGQDVARSATFIAVFVSTHFLGMLGVLTFLWTIFTLIGWNRFGNVVSKQTAAIGSYAVGYLVVKLFLRRVVCNTWLSTEGSARRPRALSDFTFCLCVYYVFTGILAALTRIVMFVPFMFVAFCRLDRSMFPEGWQHWDTPHRAFQSTVQHHTRTTNPIAWVFAEQLFEANRTFRARAVGDPATSTAPPPAARRARNRWQVARTLIANPKLQQLRRRSAEARSPPTESGTESDEPRSSAVVHNAAFAGLDGEASA